MLDQKKIQLLADLGLGFAQLKDEWGSRTWVEFHSLREANDFRDLALSVGIILGSPLFDFEKRTYAVYL